MRFSTMLTLAILVLSFLTSQTFALSLSQPGQACIDPAFGLCTITFYLDPKLDANLDRTLDITIAAPTWTAILSSVTSPSNECSLSTDRRSLVLQPKNLPVGSNIVTCVLTILDNTSVVGVTVLSAGAAQGITLPPMVYYVDPFAFRTYSTSCGAVQSLDPCEAEFIFPVPAMPFTVQTSSTITISSMQCVDGYLLTPIPVGTSGIQATSVDAVPSTDKVNNYVFSINPAYAQSTMLVVCRTFFGKSPISPYFRVIDRTGLLIYQHNKILGNYVRVTTDSDCSDPTTNSCLLIYRFSSKVPDYSDFQVQAPGFADQLSAPISCPANISQPDTDQFTYVCQRWRKMLARNTYPNGTTSPPVLVDTFRNTKLSFNGQFFYGITATLDPTLIKYTTPLKWVFPAEGCVSLQFLCPLSVRSTHAGTPVEIYAPIPYSGLVSSVSCNSPNVSFNVGERKLLIGGGPGQKQIVEKPETYWECTIQIKKTTFATNFSTPSIHNIYLYRESSPPFLTNHLLPAAALTAIPLEPFYLVPLDTSALDDCTDPVQDWCTVYNVPLDGSEYPQSFDFSVAGIVDKVRDGDWALEWDDISLNTDSAGNTGTMVITAQRTVYNFPLNVPDDAHILADVLPKHCEESTLRRCRRDVTEPVQITHDCVEPCDPADPDNPEHPCERCADPITLFSATITGRIYSGFKFRYRKQPWIVSYKSIIWFYSYGNVLFPFGRRFGTGDFDSGIPATEVVATFHPDYAVTFDSCDSPYSITCNLAVSRTSVDVKKLYYDIDSRFLVPGAVLGSADVFNTTSGLTQKVTYSELSNPAITFLDLWMPFSKVVGANTVMSVKVYPVKTVDGRIEFDGPAHVHTTDLIYTGDGLPAFEEDCEDTSASHCTINFVFQSLLTKMARPARPVTTIPIDIIKFYVPASDYILYDANTTKGLPGFMFDPIIIGEVMGTTRIANERDYTTRIKIEGPYTCIGTDMDITTTFGLVYSPEETTPTGQRAGTLTIQLLTGEVPYGATCRLIMTKRSTRLATRRVREHAIAQYGQNYQDWKTSPENFMVRFPRSHYSKLTLVSGRDCQTQFETMVCTVTCTVHATVTSPLASMRSIFPSTIQHPYFPIGKVIPVWTTQPNADGISVQVQMGEMRVTQVSTSTHITMYIFDAYQTKTTTGFLLFSPAILVNKTPWGARTFAMNFTETNGGAYQPNAVNVQFPPSIVEPIFSVASNLTRVDASTSNGIVSVNFSFKYKGINSVNIDQNFAFSPRLVQMARAALTASQQTPSATGSIANPNRIPCYLRPPGLFTEEVSLSNFAQHFETTDPAAAVQHTIVAWVVSDPVTKTSVLTPIDPAVMDGATCYLYYQVDRNTKSNQVAHEIMAVSNGQSGPAVLTVYYEAGYPSFIYNSKVIPLS